MNKAIPYPLSNWTVEEELVREGAKKKIFKILKLWADF